MNTAQLKLQQSIEVKVQPRYLPEQSNEELAEYTFAYTVRIVNNSEQSVQLLARHWIITDGDGQVRHVEGEGVVGEQPVLKPGESFEYTSGCPLSTPVGTMRGSYQMQTADRALFQVEIPEFTLAVPSAIN